MFILIFINDNHMPSALAEGIKERDCHMIMLLSFIIVYAERGCDYD